MSPTATFRFPRLPWLVLLLIGTLGLNACSDECETTMTYTVQEPIQITRAAMIGAVKSEPARPLSKTGKIYSKDHLVFINELYQGIHIIDNSNPAQPRPLTFINIPGNVDLAIQDDVLYADAGPDLLALDISDINQVTVRKHLFNTFEEIPTTGTTFTGPQPTMNDNITVGYNTRVVTSTRPCDNGPVFTDGRNRDGFFTTQMAAPASSKAANVSTGVGGSMARFTILDQYLYAVSLNAMRVYNLADPVNPTKGVLIPMWGGIETIFPYQNKLFIGSMSGMLIYDVSNGANPTYLGGYSHVRSCDPVVVDGNYAYVTLRTNPNGMCGPGNANQLDVVDISNPRAPQLRRSFPMQNPYGLGIDNNTLFLCEGAYGLKAFNAQDPLAVGTKQIAHFKDMHMFDVIPLGHTLLAIGEDGLYQYDYTDPRHIRFLSKIPVTKP